MKPNISITRLFVFLIFLILVFAKSACYATPIFIEGITDENLKNLRGINQPPGNYCVPTVGYMMFLYWERRGYDLLKDGWTETQRINDIATMMKTDFKDGTEMSKAETAMAALFDGYQTGKNYEGWAQVNDSGKWKWDEIVRQINEKTPIMLNVTQRLGDTFGHSVFVFGYEILNVGLPTESDWIYLFDPYADRSGDNTSRNPKKWKIDKKTLHIDEAIDVIDSKAHLDLPGQPYVSRNLDSLLVGSPIPEPATLLLLGSGLVGIIGFGRKRLFKKA